MPELNLRSNHKPVRDYYTAQRQYSLLHATHEGAVKAAFGTLLQQCAKQFDWTVLGEFELARNKQASLRVDAAVVDGWRLPRGYWEAKDEHDDLSAEVRKKLALGYPNDNILFQSPERAILVQNGKQVLDEQLADASTLVQVLKEFFRYQPVAFEEWEQAVEEFGNHVPKLAGALLALIEKERGLNKRFVVAFGKFMEVCRASMNQNLSELAVEKMLVQHILTERIFRKVFDNPDFARRNIIAIEIERVIDALVGRAFNRQRFLGDLDRFYIVLEKAAASVDSYTQKQHFLNSVYERFFQKFDAKTADTQGVVYTPQPIVKFMVRSVDEILRKSFGRALGDRDVHVIDPFVGTGNFLVNVMRQIPKTKLENKYTHELHANENMLLPYYTASMNIEHEYAELSGEYKPFEGMCFVDTFEPGEGDGQPQPAFTERNMERIERQKRAPIFVVIGNPPYNANQVNENDNNKNKRYPKLEARVRATFCKGSSARNLNKLNDPYVKALRWATDRIKGDGVIAFVTNNSFVHGRAFDAMRRELLKEFGDVYILDLGGDVRRNSKLSGTVHNVFGGQVGVSINLLVRNQKVGRGVLRYFSFDEYARREEKFRVLDASASLESINWSELKPDARHTWVRTGLRDDFADLIPLVGKGRGGASAAPAIFELASNGLKSNDDAHIFRFDRTELAASSLRMVEAYNAELARWRRSKKRGDVDAFLRVDPRVLKWIVETKQCLVRDVEATYDEGFIRPALYRPFTTTYAYVDKLFISRLYQLRRILPDEEASVENRLIVATCHSQTPFSVQATNLLPCVDVGGRPSMCFPFYRYDNGVRQENVTDFALEHFREKYADSAITKWAIFHYVYAILHHSEYRERYGANLRRELPRVPCAGDFWRFSKSGKQLMDLHVGWESQPVHELRHVETPGEKLDWRVSRMKLRKDRDAILYNQFLRLEGIPSTAFEHRIGGRSALEWVVDQYQVSTDARTGITNDPNRADDPQFIVNLLGKVVGVSVATVKLVKSLPGLDAPATPSRPPIPVGRGTQKPKPITKVRESRARRKAQ